MYRDTSFRIMVAVEGTVDDWAAYELQQDSHILSLEQQINLHDILASIRGSGIKMRARHAQVMFPAWAEGLAWRD